jgi:hypothetical protein
MEETLPKSEIVGVPYFHSAQNSEFTMQRKKFTNPQLNAKRPKRLACLFSSVDGNRDQKKPHKNTSIPK